MPPSATVPGTISDAWAWTCTRGRAVWAAAKRFRDSGWVTETDRVVLFNTGTGLEYR